MKTSPELFSVAIACSLGLLVASCSPPREVNNRPDSPIGDWLDGNRAVDRTQRHDHVQEKYIFAVRPSERLASIARLKDRSIEPLTRNDVALLVEKKDLVPADRHAYLIRAVAYPDEADATGLDLNIVGDTLLVSHSTSRFYLEKRPVVVVTKSRLSRAVLYLTLPV